MPPESLVLKAVIRVWMLKVFAPRIDANRFESAPIQLSELSFR
jgi:hypothetical protein